jgi:hypothetical protein
VPRDEDPTRGWPTGDRHPYLVEGQIQQFGKLATGLRHNRRGRAHVLRLTLWFAAVLGALTAATLLWPGLRP